MTLAATRPGAEPVREAADDQPPRDSAAAARAAMAQVLRQRADLARDLDGEIGRLVEQALARLAAELAAAPSDYRAWVLPRLVEAAQRILDELAAAAAAQAAAGLRRAAELGAAVVDAPIAAESATLAVTPITPAAPAAVATAAPSVGLGVPQLQQLRAMQHFTTGLIKGATDATVNQINRQLGQVVLGAAAPFDAIRAVSALLPERTRAQVRGIVNTNLATAFNSAAFERLRQQAARDPAIKKQWRRSGKLRSRDNHDAADGQVQDVDKPFVLVDGHKPGRFVELMYPADPAAPVGEVIHCGCVALPWKATWKMRQPAASPRPATPKPPPKKPAAKKAKPVSSTQTRILDAFAPAGGTWPDVTGGKLVIDQRLAPAGIGDARLTRPGGVDLYSYNAVQTVKRPTEVWEQQRVDATSGGLIRERLFIKRFEAAGQQWVGQARFAWDGQAWQPLGPYQATAAGADAGPEMTALRAGARVYPARR